jgi:putative endonuclease
MHFVYIIFSPSLNRYYVGESENPELRLSWHNDHEFKKASTVITSDWELVKTFKVVDRSAARVIEKYIKSMKSSNFLSQLISDQRFDDNFRLLVMKKFGIEVN